MHQQVDAPCIRRPLVLLAPQLYVAGEFVGGSDICEQMAGNGELQELLRKQ